MSARSIGVVGIRVKIPMFRWIGLSSIPEFT